MILYLEKGKTIILKCFKKNVNKFSKEIMMNKYITDSVELSSEEKNSDKKEGNSDEENYIEE